MDPSLEHLPEKKRNELAYIARTIAERCPGVGLVMLFGSYARGDWKEEADLPPEHPSGHPSDYDILAVTDDTADCDAGTWLAISKQCNSAGLSTHARIIHHEIGFLNRQLARGQYFFCEIVSQGKILHRDPGFDLAQPATPGPAERLQAAEEGYAHWFERSRRFFGLHKSARENDWLPEAAFNLHQAAESAYKAVLIVFTGYIPKEHYLELLGLDAADLDPRFAAIFPKADPTQRQAFQLLDYAYIGARYDPQYRIDEATVEYLAGRVEQLLELTKEACTGKIDALRAAQG
jgi:HEPN domain-containing protein